MRELTQKEKQEIREASKMIDHYKTGIALLKMKIQIIKDRQQIDEWTEMVSAPIEF